MRLDTPNTTQLTQNVYFQLNFRFTFSHYKNDNYMEKKQRKKEERKIYVEEQQQQPVQSETHNWRVLCMRETKKAIWHILFHSLFVIITFIMRFFFHSEASSAQPSMPVDSFKTICLLSQTESTWRGREQ